MASQSSRVTVNFGKIEVASVPILSGQGVAISDVPVVTTIGSNTGTPAAGLSLIGDTSSIDQSAALMNDLASIQEDLAALRTTINLLITSLENQGLIVSS